LRLLCNINERVDYEKREVFLTKIVCLVIIIVKKKR